MNSMNEKIAVLVVGLVFVCSGMGRGAEPFVFELFREKQKSP